MIMGTSKDKLLKKARFPVTVLSYSFMCHDNLCNVSLSFPETCEAMGFLIIVLFMDIGSLFGSSVPLDNWYAFLMA